MMRRRTFPVFHLLQSKRAGARGFSLIELMVAMTIGLVVAIVISVVLSSSEGRKRTLTSVNDIDQAGNYGAFILGKLLRNAGSGFSQSRQLFYGCALNAAANGAAVVPPPNLPAPFAGTVGSSSNALQAITMAPLIVLKGASPDGKSDVILTMAGAAGVGEVPIYFSGAPTTSALNLLSTVGFKANDLVLLADAAVPGYCMLEQVASNFGGGAGVTNLPLAGNYYAAQIGSNSMTSYTVTGMAVGMGNATPGASEVFPAFTMIGVGNHTSDGENVLYGYDLLQGGGVATPLVNGVRELHALYYVDTNSDGVADTWEDPGVAPYDAQTLSQPGAGGAAGVALYTIKAVRIGMILQTALPERAVKGQPVSPGSFTLFADTPFPYTFTPAGNDQNFRYRLVEVTIPLRNVMLN